MTIAEKDNQLLNLLTEWEREYWAKNILCAGLDEAGRGPLAGPLAVGCVVMSPDNLIPGVNDSKKLSEKKRTALAPRIREAAIYSKVVFISPEEIDSIGIQNAVLKAFGEAHSGIDFPHHVFVDQVAGLRLADDQTMLIHGDALSYSIACASILAKTERDALMINLAEQYPEYGFEKHKGYGTADHIAAIKKYGPCPIHRRSFIKNFV